MAAFKNILIFLVMSALLNVCLGQVAQGGPHVSQDDPHQNQGRNRRQVSQNDDEVNQVNVNDDQATPNVPQNPQNWTICDVTAIPKISCHDCNTRIICKPVGGLLKPCNNPYRPYCNLGICSPIPSPVCV